MAFLRPEALTCSACGYAAELVWVVGVGPRTKPGQGPAYVRPKGNSPWTIETLASAPEWAGTVTCPACGVTVKASPVRAEEKSDGKL